MHEVPPCPPKQPEPAAFPRLPRAPFRQGSRSSKGTDPSSFCVCDGGKPTSRSSHKHAENIKRGKIMQKHINYVDDGKPMRTMICARNSIFPRGLIASFGAPFEASEYSEESKFIVIRKTPQ